MASHHEIPSNFPSIALPIIQRPVYDQMEADLLQRPDDTFAELGKLVGRGDCFMSIGLYYAEDEGGRDSGARSSDEVARHIRVVYGLLHRQATADRQQGDVMRQLLGEPLLTGPVLPPLIVNAELHGAAEAFNREQTQQDIAKHDFLMAEAINGTLYRPSDGALGLASSAGCLASYAVLNTIARRRLAYDVL